jgi:hypothetical protein
VDEQLQNVWAVAQMLVDKHGIRARSFAEHQALRAQHRGDTASMHGWRSVAQAAEAILNGNVPGTEEG